MKSHRGLAEIFRSERMPRSTAYRILMTLESRGYPDRTQDGSYRMETELFNLQRDSSIEQQRRRVAWPSIEGLAARWTTAKGW